MNLFEFRVAFGLGQNRANLKARIKKKKKWKYNLEYNIFGTAATAQSS